MAEGQSDSKALDEAKKRRRHRSARKRERQNLKLRRRNRGNMIALRKELKRVSAAIAGGGADAQASLAKGYSMLDRAARKHAIPKKRADRKKARLALALARAGKSVPTAPSATPPPAEATPPA